MALDLNKLKLIAAKYKEAALLNAPVSTNSIRSLLLNELESANDAAEPKETAISIAANKILIADIERTDAATFTDRFGKSITYNELQLKFVTMAQSGINCVLIGAAGTGKTTCMKGTTNNLIMNGNAGLMDAGDHKYLISGSPGIVVVAFTRRAVNNIARNMSEDMKGNCITIHKLLEYEPVFYEVWNEVKGKMVNKVEFRPARNSMRPLPNSIRTIIFEESSMVGTDLYAEVQEAMPHKHQEIFLGDIQQLPPVFGPAILGFKLLEIPVVELLEVYRQALESPIIRLAHRILSGIPIEPKELKTMIVPGKLSISPWSKTITPSSALMVLGTNTPDKNGHMGFFPQSIKNGGYDPQEDMILIPQNVGLGTQELNKYIAQYIAHTNGREVWEVVAGFEKHYFSVGDKVMYERADGTIIKIESNPMYAGIKGIRAPSKTLSYWGMEMSRVTSVNSEDAAKAKSMEDVDFILAQASVKDEDRVHQASHRITVLMADSDKEVTLDKANQINNTILGYALTVHKSQGSEWRRVFIVLHKEHNRMLQRELLYTAVTRAKEELVIICELDHFVKGIESQKIKGNTLAEKAEQFKGKQKVNKEEMES